MTDKNAPGETTADTGVIRDDPMIAAEFALGLLEGEELLAARGRLAQDAAFAARREWWDNWFVPLTDEVAGAEPSADLWARIEAAIAAPQPAAKGGDAASHAADRNVIDLQARLRRWQWTAAITSMAAAVALAVLVFAPGQNPAQGPGPSPQLAAAEPLVATVPIGETGLRLDVTYLPDSERMLVTAIGLEPDGVHDHELWLVPAKGELQSLGVVRPGEVINLPVSDAVARNILDGSQVVLTREPLGGKPAGKDAGPVVAEGAFGKV